MKTVFGLTICLLLFFGINANCQSKMVSIKGGKYIPLYGRESLQVKISDFYMDIFPVTNQEFQQFVIKNPKWKKSMAKKIFADKNYLANWKSDIALNH
jgi:formylglycine-generating enzyme required for sulfatase activity